MLSKKNMIVLFIIFIVIVVCIAVLGWHFIFGKPNPPLPQQQVTVQSSSTAAAPTTTLQTSSDSDSVDEPNPPLPEESFSVDNATFTVEVASTMLQQARGLSYRTSLGVNDGMLFVFSSGSVQSFWMKDMNFPLDMIWISGNTVVGFAQNALAAPGVLFPSQIFYSPANTDKVLEVNSGTVAKYNIKVGDIVTISPLVE